MTISLAVTFLFQIVFYKRLKSLNIISYKVEKYYTPPSMKNQGTETLLQGRRSQAKFQGDFPSKRGSQDYTFNVFVPVCSPLIIPKSDSVVFNQFWWKCSDLMVDFYKFNENWRVGRRGRPCQFPRWQKAAIEPNCCWVFKDAHGREALWMPQLTEQMWSDSQRCISHQRIQPRAQTHREPGFISSAAHEMLCCVIFFFPTFTLTLQPSGHKFPRGKKKKKAFFI